MIEKVYEKFFSKEIIARHDIIRREFANRSLEINTRTTFPLRAPRTSRGNCIFHFN